MYNYHDSPVRTERLSAGTDHCDSKGKVFPLLRLVNTRGEVVDPCLDGVLLDTENGENVIYAVSGELDVHIGIDGTRGVPDAVKHETLFHNANVRAAGEIVFRQGKVVALNDHSGSYGTYGMLATDPEFAEAVVAGFEKAGVAMRQSLRNSLKKLLRAKK